MLQVNSVRVAGYDSGGVGELARLSQDERNVEVSGFCGVWEQATDSGETVEPCFAPSEFFQMMEASHASAVTGVEPRQTIVNRGPQASRCFPSSGQAPVRATKFAPLMHFSKHGCRNCCVPSSISVRKSHEPCRDLNFY